MNRDNSMEPVEASPIPRVLPVLIVDGTDAASQPASEISFQPSEHRLSGRRFLCPQPAMAADNLAEIGSQADTPSNPFNFQTQVISTSPIKSVRCSPVPSITETPSPRSSKPLACTADSSPRTLANAGGTATSTVAFLHSTRYFRSLRRDHLPFFLHLCLFLPSRRLGRVRKRINALGSTGAFATLPLPFSFS